MTSQSKQFLELGHKKPMNQIQITDPLRAVNKLMSTGMGHIALSAT